MPLYDAVTGQPVPAELDERVERLRDQLMDEARERVDELGEEAVAGGHSSCREASRTGNALKSSGLSCLS